MIGDAVMTQGSTVLKADQITVMRKAHRAHAVGHVHLTDPEVEVWASKADLDFQNETLELQDATVLAKRNTYHLEGKRITKLPGQKYVVMKGFFTTCGCEPGTPDWSLSADDMHITMGDIGTAKNPTFSVLGYPVIPLPYAEFPADTGRHSGLLTGREGESGLRGFQYVQPYYLAINQSMDATVALDVETSQRIGGLAEYRLSNGPDDYFWANAAYYNESIRSTGNRIGDIADTQLADPAIPINRYGLIGTMREHLTPDLTLFGNGNTVSDNLYLREMDVWTLSRGYGNNFGSLRDAQSHLGLLDEFDDGFVRLQGTWTEDLIQDQHFTLQQLPDIWSLGRRELPGNFAYLDYDADAVNYWRQKGNSGLRLSLNPRVTVPWRLGDYLTGFVTGGLWGNFYESSGHNVDIVPVGDVAIVPIDGVLRRQILTFNNVPVLAPTHDTGLDMRAIPYLQSGISTELERVYGLDWQYIDKLKHTIEPFIDYDYTPSISQSGVPLYDERDRINGRSLIVYGFTSRLYAHMNSSASTPEVPENAGAESGAVTSADAGQGIENQNNGRGGINDTGNTNESHSPAGTTRELVSMTLMQAYDTNYAVQPGQVALSDIQGLFNFYPTSVVSFGAQFGYDPRSNPGISYTSVEMNLQPPWNPEAHNLYMGKALQGSFMQVAYGYVRRENTVESSTSRNASQEITLRAYYDLIDRMGFYFAPNYDLAASRMLSTEYGLRLKSPCDCWAFDIGITQSYNPNEVQVQVQATLGGLGSIGQSPFGRNPFSTMGLTGRPMGVLPTY